MKSPARERILDSASELFYASGLRAVGVDTVIAHAGVAKASLYKHFPTKDDLVVAFLERRDAAWRAWLAETVEQVTADPSEKPLAIFDALAQRFRRKDFRGCAFINTMVETADGSHRAHQAAARHKKAVLAYIAGLLDAAGFDAVDALAYSLLMLVDGAIVTAVRDGTPDAAATAKRTAAVLLAAAPRKRTRISKKRN